MGSNAKVSRRFVATEMNGGKRLPTAHTYYTQGYVACLNALAIYVMNVRNMDHTIEAKMVYETETSLESFDIDAQLGGVLFHNCDKRLAKYCHHDGRFEINVWQGALNGLVTLEIELASATEPFDKPDWVDQWVDVTDTLSDLDLARLEATLDHKAPPHESITEMVLRHFGPKSPPP